MRSTIADFRYAYININQTEQIFKFEDDDSTIVITIARMIYVEISDMYVFDASINLVKDPASVSAERNPQNINIDLYVLHDLPPVMEVKATGLANIAGEKL